MDKIQKALVAAGRKDLAQQYYNKIAAGTFKDMDMDKAKEKIFVEKFNKSLPNLEKLLKSVLGYDLKATAKNVNNSKFFTIDLSPSFSGKDLGIMQFALKKAEFGMHCNPNPSKEKIWFPVSLGWEHYSGGTNGGDIKVKNNNRFSLWYNVTTGEWEQE